MKEYEFIDGLFLERVREKMNDYSKNGWELEKIVQVCDTIGNIHTTVLMSKEIEKNGK